MDACTWLEGQMGIGEKFHDCYVHEGPCNHPVFMQLVDMGYDVWIGNPRGTKFSNVNPKFENADDPSHPDFASLNAQKYDYTWKDQGVSDLPAFMDKMIEQSGRDKVTVVGFEQGANQLLYALTQKEETYFEDKLEKAVILAPCLYPGTLGIDSYKQIFPVYAENEINVVNTPYWPENLEKICEGQANARACFAAKRYNNAPETTKSLELSA